MTHTNIPGLVAEAKQAAAYSDVRPISYRLVERLVEALEESDRLITHARREAWTDGARWAAVECGAIPHEGVAWLAPGDNPHDKEAEK